MSGEFFKRERRGRFSDRKLMEVLKMIVAQRRRDKDIGHLPEKRDKSKLREDRRKPVGIDSRDPDLNDTKRDPDLRSGFVETARSLVAMARELISEE